MVDSPGRHGVRGGWSSSCIRPGVCVCVCVCAYVLCAQNEFYTRKMVPIC